MKAIDGPLRVLLVDHTASLSGGQLALARLCAALDPAEVQVRVVLFEDGPLVAFLRARGLQVDVVALDPRVGSTGRHGLASVAALRAAASVVPFVVRLARFVRSVDPHLVHTETLKADVLGTVAARLARVPVVWYVHDRIADDYLPGWVACVFRWAAATFPRAVIANSEASAATLTGDVTVAYPGFGPEQVRVDAIDREEPDVPTVGLVGRISPTKGQLEFVRAARRVLDTGRTARFRIVGSPMFGAEDYAGEVADAIAALGLSDDVTLEGFSDQVSDVLDGFSVLVHASPVPEPFGQVVVEAMIRGVPVIATDAGGVPEILDGGRVGLLVPPGDVDALADAVSVVLDDPAASRERAARAYASAIRRFPASVTAEVVTEVWRGAAARGRSPRA